MLPAAEEVKCIVRVAILRDNCGICSNDVDKEQVLRSDETWLQVRIWGSTLKSPSSDEVVDIDGAGEAGYE